MTEKNINDTHFCWPIRVYYEDTDAAGVVFYANYLKYMERARTEWLRALGFEQDVIKTNYSTIFVVRSVNIDYLSPARFNEQLSVVVEVIDITNARITFKQHIVKTHNQQENRKQPLKKQTVAMGVVSIVCVDAETFKPKRIPQPIKEVLIRGA